MIKQHFLKLVYAGFNTRQIHKIYLQYPSLFDETVDSTHFKHRLETCMTTPALKKKFQTFLTLNEDLIQQQLAEQHINIISINDSVYPPLLKEIYDPPFILFCKGDTTLFADALRSLSIVGAHQYTDYTPQALNYLFPHFKKAQLTIVSGLAYGTDAIAHQCALNYHLPTIGVLGFGHQVHYPSQTQSFRNQIENVGLTISEYPPHTPPARFRFPERNRIISGLSKGVLVTEAKERSGALITIDQALDQNRNVYVLPGTMFDKHTRGNLLRVKEGAEIVLSEKDILKDYI